MVAEYKQAKMSKTKMSKQSANSEILEAINSLKIQMSQLQTENEQLKNALAEEGNRTHFNPEQNQSTKLQFKLGAKREETIQDRVFNSLFN